MFQIATDDTAHVRVRAAARRFFSARGTQSQIPAHLGKEPLGLLQLVPGKILEIFLAQSLDSAVGCALWITQIVVVILIIVNFTGAAFELACLATQLFALLVRVHVLGQPLALRRGQAHLALFASNAWSRTSIVLLVRIIAYKPEVSEHLVKD